jgi:hypothetical protein
MSRAGFEPVIPMFERPKTVLALDRAAIETGLCLTKLTKLIECRPIHHEIPLYVISCSPVSLTKLAYCTAAYGDKTRLTQHRLENLRNMFHNEAN